MPLCIDLFCGLGGWTEGFLSEGWDVIGFDIERHVYAQLCPMCKGTGICNGIPDCLACNRSGKVAQRYPAQLVLGDVLGLWGSQFRHVDCIVASPPCQKYSYMAMPWSRAKALAAWYREIELRQIALNALFNACFRIQREACEAAGRHIPMVVENVKGAQPWVGPAKANFGSFYFWGDVHMVGSQVVAGAPRFGETVKAAKRGAQKRNPDGTAHPQGSWFAVADSKERGAATKNDGGSWFNIAHNTDSGTGNNPDGRKGPGGDWFAEGRQGQDACAEALKVPGINWNGYGSPDYKPQGFNVTAAQRYREERGTKQNGSGPEWFDEGIAKYSSRSDSRKAASAQIAKIPFPLANYIARAFKPGRA
jgi:hypothetical protein